MLARGQASSAPSTSRGEVTSFPTWYFSSISLSPDRATYLAISSSGLEKCTLATGSCAIVTTSGVADGDAPSQVWIDPVDATRVFLSTSNGSALHFYTATDGDTAFTAVPLPDAPIWGPPIFAPGTPSKIAVQLSITDISGLAFDAAGTLFLVRDWTLYSKSTFE